MSLYEKIKHITETKLLEQWRDTRLWGLVVFCVVVVLASWSGARVIETNYALQKKIAKLGQQNQVYELQNENKKLENQYYETDTYLELAARKQFSKGLPGEGLILVPKDIALRHAPEIPNTTQVSAVQPAAPSHQPTYLKNLQAWRDFVFGHTLQ